jgi:hypothetical protein
MSIKSESMHKLVRRRGKDKPCLSVSVMKLWDRENPWLRYIWKWKKNKNYFDEKKDNAQ